MQVVLINGPNLDLLGIRQPEIYGSTTLEDLENSAKEWGSDLGMRVNTLQTNHEAEIVDAIHGAADADGLVINPAIFTHTSEAIGDAVASLALPTVEVHISNVKEREPWRQHSFVEPHAVRTIYGRGIRGYRDALRHLHNRAISPFETKAYGPEPDHVGDLRVPPNPQALVVLLHGGFLLRQWERDGIEDLAVDLTHKGYATWNLEYRRLGTGGGWPNSVDDVVLALDHIPDLPGVSGLPVVTLGHSAGGFLALISGTRVDEAPSATIGLSPITDLQQVVDQGTIGSEIAHELLGAGAPPRLPDLPANAHLIHASQDEVVHPSHSVQFEDRVAVTIVEAGHFDFLDARKSAWTEARSVIAAIA